MVLVTLDSNVVLEYLKSQQKADVVERHLELGDSAKIDLAVTARIHEDVPRSPLADRIADLSQLGVSETGAVTRLGVWVLGRDMLGDDTVLAVFEELDEQAAKAGRRAPDWRDRDHLHAHFLAKRNVFLTWDGSILEEASELEARLGICVCSPERFLEEHAGE